MFKTSSDEFRKQRNLMKPALSNFMKKEGGLNESSEGDNTYLRNLSTPTIVGYIKDDFLNRLPIEHPSLMWILRGALCRLKSYRKYKKLHERSQKKLGQELDILNVINTRRMMLASNFGKLHRRH